MPLHLLGKKSWNVYNADNIARVRRDEAAAKAAEEAEEQRMQELDAQRRLAILRGEEPPPLEETTDAKEEAVESRNSVPVGYPGGSQRARKRKRYGEDDTDFELRLAKERDSLNVARTDNAVSATRKPTSSAPIVDHAGHIDLFGDDKTRAHAEKNEEAEKEAKKKKQEYEDQYTMRFANATGRHGTNNPWYSHSSSDLAAVAAEPPSKDVWGNEDPRRREREAQRTVANDPLAMMKKGASKVRELKQERKKFQEERDEELRQLRREERHEEKPDGDDGQGMPKEKGVMQMKMNLQERKGGIIVIVTMDDDIGGTHVRRAVMNDDETDTGDMATEAMIRYPQLCICSMFLGFSSR